MSNKTSSASEQSFVYPSGAPGCFLWVSLCATFSFHVVFCEPLFVFVLFPLAIVLFAYRFTYSDTTSTGYWWQFPGLKRTVLFRLDRDPSRWGVWSWTILGNVFGNCSHCEAGQIYSFFYLSLKHVQRHLVFSENVSILFMPTI